MAAVPGGVGIVTTDPREEMTIASMEGSATWLETNTWERPRWTVADVLARKGDRTISVVLPALDEEATVGSVVESIRPLVGNLVDELVVVDSGSADDTITSATGAGARVETRESALPGVPVVREKVRSCGARWRRRRVTSSSSSTATSSTPIPSTCRVSSRRSSLCRSCTWSRATTVGRWSRPVASTQRVGDG